VPHAYKLQKEHGKSFVALLVESQGTSKKEDMVGFVMQNFTKYANDDVFITYGENPFPSGIDGLPQCALIGVDGRVLMIGHNGDLGGKLDDAIEAELKKVQTGWGKSPEAKKARSLMYGKGKLADAAKVLADAEGKVKEDAKADFEEAKAELEARYTALKGSIKQLTEDGRFVAANAAALNLQKSVKGKAEWETEVAGIVGDFAKPEVDKELKLDKAVAGIIKAIGDKRPTDDHEKKFKDLAKKNEGTKVGARASELAAACSWKDGGGAAKRDKDEKDPKDPPKKDGGSGSKGN
jgi:hypothetical protein